MTNSYIGRVTALNSGATDLDANDSDTDTIDNSWIEFADTYTEATGGTDYPWPPDETGYGTDEYVTSDAEFTSSRNRVGSAVCVAAVAAAIAFSPVPSTGAAVTISAGADFENATVITADVAGDFSASSDLQVSFSPDVGGSEFVATGADLQTGFVKDGNTAEFISVEAELVIGPVKDGQVVGSFEVSEQGTYTADLAGGTDYPWPPDDTGYGINGEISTGAEIGVSIVAPADVAVTISTGADLAVIQNKDYEGDAIGYIDVGEGTYTASVGDVSVEDNDLRFIIWYRSDRQ
jgi:hypothetical protein